MCLGVNGKAASPAGNPAPVKPVDTKKVTFRVVVLVGLFSFFSCHVQNQHLHIIYISTAFTLKKNQTTSTTKIQKHCRYKYALVMINFHAHNISISVYFLKLEDLQTASNWRQKFLQLILICYFLFAKTTAKAFPVCRHVPSFVDEKLIPFFPFFFCFVLFLLIGPGL